MNVNIIGISSEISYVWLMDNVRRNYLYPERVGPIVVATSKSNGMVIIIFTPAFSNCLLISSENIKKNLPMYNYVFQNPETWAVWFGNVEKEDIT